MMQELKDDIHLVVIGHEGSGKSTTIGNLMYQKGGIDPLILSQYELEAVDIDSKRPAKYAWVLNKLAADRSSNPLSFEPLSSRLLNPASQLR
ncbi:Ef1p [Entomophthora muscae]|uniref:Ef1p n=1 Tax=Entomophthora muscae TaxID=34485 RepID=A0ACC2TPQ9_9FUNG|nr:Ef1p [Entomophthora muscae]